MTESQCLEIIQQARQRFGIADARVVHRVGKLNPSEQIVFVAVAGEHRAEAFQAAEFIMDYLKSTATIWKKEVGDKGVKWLGVKPKDADAAKRWDT
jgi:molybdopterin synthase catalytic subunit